ncbi:MAG: TIR domain-containing protein [Alphaproteobacteria bacterium]
MSYARTERDDAEAIKARLEALGLSVFLDVEGLDGGDVFSDVLDREVKTSGVVLGLWSPTALSRPWVQIECDIGKRRGVLVPVAIKPFTDMQTPAAFWNIQFVDLVEALDDPNHPNWRKLTKSLERTLKRPAGTLSPPPAKAPPPTGEAAPFGATFGAKIAETRHGPRSYVSSRPDFLPRADAAVFYTLARAAMNRETVTLPFVIAEAQRLSRSKTELTQRWLDVAFNRILRAMLLMAKERSEVIPFIAAIAVDPETHLPPESIDSAALAWIDNSYAPDDAANRMAELRADRVRAVARMQNLVFAYKDWVALLPYVGIPPANAETYLAGDGGASAPLSTATAKPPAAMRRAPASSGGKIAGIAVTLLLVVAATGAGVWLTDPFHWRPQIPAAVDSTAGPVGPSANRAPPASSKPDVAALPPWAEIEPQATPTTTVAPAAQVDTSREANAAAEPATRVVLERTLKGPKYSYGASFSPDGARIVTQAQQEGARLWDVKSGKLLAVLPGEQGIGTVEFSSDGARILTTGGTTARIWDGITGAPVMTLANAPEKIYRAAFSSDGRRVATLSINDLGHIWDLQNGTIIANLKGPGSYPNSVGFSPNGRLVVGTFLEGSALWDADTGKLRSPATGLGKINAAAFSPDSKRLVTAGNNGVATVWDLATNTSTVVFGHPKAIDSAVFSPDGKRVLTASQDSTARLSDAETGQTLAILSGHTSPVRIAAFSVDGRRILTVADYDPPRLRDGKTGKSIAVFGNAGVTRAFFSPDGKHIAATYLSGNIEILRIEGN